MKKYSKMIATLPGGVVGIMVAEGVAPMLTDAFTQFGLSYVQGWVMVVQAVIVVVSCGVAVYAAPKNAE